MARYFSEKLVHNFAIGDAIPERVKINSNSYFLWNSLNFQCVHTCSWRHDYDYEYPLINKYPPIIAV